MKKLLPVLISLFLCAGLIAQTSHSSHISFIVRDGHTGFAVWGATVKTTAPDGASSTLTANANGKLAFEAPKGRYHFSIGTDGYKSLDTFFEAGMESFIEANILLEPALDLTSAYEVKQVAASQLVIVQGYVRDEGANSPLAGVAIQAGNATAITNNNGYFSILAGTSAHDTEEKNSPEKITVQFSKPGYKTHVIENISAVAGTHHVKIAIFQCNVCGSACCQVLNDSCALNNI
jgi:hypothetical protein